MTGKAGHSAGEAQPDQTGDSPISALVAELDGPPWARVLRVVGHREAERLMATMGVEARELPSLTQKVLHRLVQVGPLPNPLARSLKSHFTHVGGDAAIPGAAYDQDGESEVILIGRLDQLSSLCRRLEIGVPELRRVGEVLDQALRRDANVGGEVRARDFRLECGRATTVMGILNVTPDSFSDGGLFESVDAAIKRGVEMVAEGAGIIDVGGASSRPNADEVDPSVEAERVIPVIKELASEIEVPISIDTTNAGVAEAAIDAGASIVNDITALTADPAMGALAAATGAAVVLMHMRGNPRTMTSEVEYEDLVGEVWQYLAERIIAAVDVGIDPAAIVVDPGIGFAKTSEQSLTILRRLGEFRSLGAPLLVGVSRKSFIGQALELPVGERLEGTLAAVAWCVFQGAWGVRVHDVGQASRACRMIDAILSAP
ncbi:MAG: dihydropteroate synthase [Acidobacteria bacterium]|nr:MAG: dihydropteroate synthase [Acidobacteriota bacterium]